MRCSSSAPASQCVSFVHTVHVWACVYLYVCTVYVCLLQSPLWVAVIWGQTSYPSNSWVTVETPCRSVYFEHNASWACILKKKETRVQNQFFISIYNYSRWTLIAKYLSLLLDRPMHPVLTEDGSPKSTYLSCWSSDKTPVPFGVLCQKLSDGW